jgi:pimeloyl-ACP methyl ester carboxylesterase
MDARRIPLKPYRLYREAPFRSVLVHGGPGALGELAPVAKTLSENTGTIEAQIAADSVEGQINEVSACLDRAEDGKTLLFGHSWGAWLSILSAAKHPEKVHTLVLCGCPPFRKEDARDIMETRLSRLKPSDRKRLENLLPGFEKAGKAEFNELAKILAKADTADGLPGFDTNADTDFRPDIYRAVWPQAEAFRREGKLLDALDALDCRVILIHGDFDPHPFEATDDILRSRIRDYRAVLLLDCGHRPWVERAAREKFFRVLRGLITN